MAYAERERRMPVLLVKVLLVNTNASLTDFPGDQNL